MPSSQLTAPPQTHRPIRTALRWLWRLVLALVVLVLICIGVLYAWVVPRLDEWRPELVAYLQQKTGLEIQIEALQASHSPNGLPVLEIQNARITRAQAPWQVSMAKAQLGLSWQLLRGQPLGNILIDKPQLQWRGALDQAAPASATPTSTNAPTADHAALAQTWQWLLEQPSIRIANGSVQWHSTSPSPTESTQETESSWQISQIDLELSYSPLRDHHRLELQMQAPQLMAAPVELQLEGQDWGRWAEGWPALSSASGSWRLKLEQLDLAALSQLLVQFPTLQAWPTIQQGLLSLRSQGQLTNGDLRPATFEIDADKLLWPLSEQTPLELTQMRLAGSLQAQGLSPVSALPRTRWQLELQPSQFKTGTSTWRSEALQLALTSAARPSHTGTKAQPGMAWPEQGIEVLAASLTSPGLDLGALSALLQASFGSTSAAPQEANLEDNVAASTWPMATAQRLGQWQQQLANWQPSGQLQDIHIGWQAPEKPAQERDAAAGPTWPWTVSARLKQLSIGAAHTSTSNTTAVPLGIHNLSGQIDSSPAGGSAALQIDNGSVQLPTVFDAGPMEIDRLRTELQWTLAQDGGVAVKIELPELATPDAAGSATILWRTSSSAEIQTLTEQTGRPAHALPGFLDLNAELTRADATAVWRYLPYSIPADVRHYVQEAILGGRAKRAEFEVRGDLTHFPFDARARDPATQRYPATAAESGKTPASNQTEAATPSRELFRISADLEQVQFRYVPHYLLGSGTPALSWPDLQGVNARLEFIGNRMDLAVQSAQLQAAPKVRVSNGKAWIDDLMHAQVGVDVRAAGPLADQLRVLSSTPVARMTDHAMDNLQGTGNAAFRLQLDIPLESAQADQIQVTGDVQLKDNALQWWPQVPRLSAVQGRVRFTDKGFAANGIQAQALGGPVTLDVAMADHVNGAPTQVRIDAQGQLSAQGLQQYAQQALGSARADQWLAALSGQTNYTLQVNTIGQRPFVSFDSSLQGLASSLPYPLDKAADAAQPLRLSHSSPDSTGLEQIQLTLGERIDARYQLRAAPTASDPQAADSRQPQSTTVATPELAVLSGQLLIGQFSADEKRLPGFIPNTFAAAPGDTRVQAIVAKDQWDAAEWLPWLMQAQSTQTKHAAASPDSASQSWIEQLMPDVWYGHFDLLQWGKLRLHDAQIQAYQGISSNASIWTTHFKATETQGTLEYHPQYLEGTGLLRGNIDYLELPAHFGQDDAQAPGAAAEADTPPALEGLDTTDTQAESSALANVRHLPTVDIEIGRLLFANRDWGKVAMQAMNRVVNGHPSEWIINYLTIEVPEARLTAKGSWQDVRTHNGIYHLLSGRKKMDMQFTLEMLDAGRLLARMGMPGVLSAGNGKLNGRLSWQGSPLHLDIPSLNGDFSLDVAKGQFLKVNAGAGRLLGVMSLQALPRRLTLDFRDIFSEGFAFDFVRGDIHLATGVASTNNLQMKGVNAGVVLEGSANILQETQNITAVVVPELDAMTASLVATAINPAIGAGTFLAQFFFSKPLAEAAAQEFLIRGSWSDPIVERSSTRTAKPAALE
ncbi:YhdP family protein [Lampropedia aestuarii]|uniref:YhdP family phospholipid transporter n=1 Tax=Lampropedia aestuarii TaxID=2562762 RepID=UPI0024685961|nr:AsmA-like C-terminal region-containing protein [Lampropedia aestuarii]MDH5857414.1 AsmA-like C-terminal region-containing protein [Lampropedia aestuarii]